MLYYVGVNARLSNCGAYIINIMINDQNVDTKRSQRSHVDY